MTLWPFSDLPACLAPIVEEKADIKCSGPVVPGTLSTAICSGLLLPRGPAILSRMGNASAARSAAARTDPP